MKHKSAAIAITVVLLASSFVIYRTRPSLFAAGTPGSFEYIRKGEGWLDKGEYKKAIAQFEKAGESSPENKAIQDYLIMVYSRYSQALLESGDFGAAIEYLNKAYGIRRDIVTMQNLALACVKMGVQLANKREWTPSIERFTTARLIVGDSARASKNIAVQLFNDGVEEYNSGREDAAMLCFREASLIEESSIVFKFLGQIYYKNSDYENASFYWNSARRIDPDDKGLADKLEALEKEAALAAGRLSRESPHFSLVYEKILPFDMESAKKALESAYFDVGKDLGYFPNLKTKVFFYSDKDFREIFRLPAVVGAFYDGNIRMPLPEGPLGADAAARYIYHEYTHAVLSAATKNNCPIWFGEGVAVWEEFKGRESIIKEMIAAIGENANLSINRLDEAFKGGLKDRDLRLCYIMAYTAVRFITDKWGIASLREIVKALASGQHIANAIDDVLLLPEKEFEARWRNYVKTRL